MQHVYSIPEKLVNLIWKLQISTSRSCKLNIGPLAVKQVVTSQIMFVCSCVKLGFQMNLNQPSSVKLYTSLCTVELEHTSEETIKKTNFLVEGDLKL